MRSLVAFYLLIGLRCWRSAGSRPVRCPNKNLDPLRRCGVCAAWPVYLYDDVVHGTMLPPELAASAGLRGWAAHSARDADALIAKGVGEAKFRAGAAPAIPLELLPEATCVRR